MGVGRENVIRESKARRIKEDKDNNGDGSQIGIKNFSTNSNRI